MKPLSESVLSMLADKPSASYRRAFGGESLLTLSSRIASALVQPNRFDKTERLRAAPDICRLRLT